MPDPTTYPRLTDIISVDSIPDNLDAIEGILEQILGEIHYKDYTSARSRSGDAGYYSLRLIFYQSLGINIGGTGGLRLLVNPAAAINNATEIDVSLSYRADFLKYKNIVKQSSFTLDPVGYFTTFLTVFGIPPKDLFRQMIKEFDNDDPNTFVNRFNASNPASPIILNSGNDPDVYTDIVLQVVNPATNNTEITQLLFNEYISGFSINDSLVRIKKVFRAWLGDFSFEKFLELFVPKFNIAINNLNLALEFPRSVFVPVITPTYNPTSGTIGDPVPEPYKTLLTFNAGSLSLNSTSGFEFINENTFDFQKSFILGTRFTLQVDDLKLDLSRTKNIQEAIADGRPEDFIGVYIKNGIVGFPAEWNHNAPGSTGELYVNNLLAGTGGLSGTIGLRGNIIDNTVTPPVREPNPLISVRFGEKFTVSLLSFDITFQQNAIVSSNIEGRLVVAGFKDAGGSDAEINIKIHIDGNGDFYVTAKEEDGITLPLHFDEYFTLTVKSLTIGKRSGKFYIATSGKIDFKNLSLHSSFLGNLLPKDVEIQKLLIWENGQIELEGGTVTLRKPVKINLGPVKLTVTALGMGSYERMHGGVLRKYKYVEFSAGISINPGGVDARGDGIKVYFSIDGGTTDVFVRIQSIAIDLIIPGSASKDNATLLLNGFLSMKEPTGSDSDAGTEYSGGIDFKLPKMKMGGSAAMKYNPKVPSFLIDVSLELSTPIVLGATGMGIYGFRALFGKQYIASRPGIGLADDAEWWQYYKKKVPPQNAEGVNVSKMSNLPGFSFGAGISLATAADGGKVFSSKLFFLLSLPDVFLLQGQAQILKERIGLDTTTDPPFFAIIAIDSTSISAGLGVNYKFPSDGASPGKIATVDALIEMAYFWNNSSAWYLNIGRDQPADRRVTARIFDLFDVYSYFMLSASGIKAGAGASFEKNYNAGIIKARLYAYMDTAGRIAFKPVQIGGSIDIGGGVDVKVLGKKFSLSANASLAAEAPKPFTVTGSIEVCVKVIKKNYCINLNLTWTFNNSLDFSDVPMLTKDVINNGSTPTASTRLTEAAKALNMMSKETLNLLGIENIPMGIISADTIPLLSDNVWNSINAALIPMDSFIDIEFRKPVKPNGDASLNKIGGVTSGANYSAYVAPQRGKSNRVRHDFLLEKLEVFSWNPTTAKWVEYNVYDAITPLTIAPFNLSASALSNLKIGNWQIDNPGYYTKMRLMAQNPLTFLAQGTGDTTAENLGVTNAIFCPPPEKTKTCVNFDSYNVKEGSTKTLVGNQIIQQQSVLMRIVSHNGTIVYKPYYNVQSALVFEDSDILEIYLPEPMLEVSMLLSTLTSHLIIKYYARVQTGTNSSGGPVFGYTLVKSEAKTPVQLNAGIIYSDGTQAIDKIEITGGNCNLGQNCDSSNGLIQLMNLIASYGEIKKDIKLSDDPRFSEFIKDIGLFPDPIPDGLTYNPTITETSITIKFSGDNYDCELRMAVSSKDTINWSNVINFQNMRPDPSQSGAPDPNNYFLIDILLNDGTTLTLSGYSKCIGVYDLIHSCETSDFSTFMNAISSNGDIKNDVKLDTDPRYTSLVNSLSLFPEPLPKGLTYNPKVGDTTLEINFTGEGYNCKVLLTSPTGIDWTGITNWTNMRPDPSKAGLPNANDYFLIDVITKEGKLITLSGQSSCIHAQSSTTNPMVCDIVPSAQITDLIELLNFVIENFGVKDPVKLDDPKIIEALGVISFFPQPIPKGLTLQPKVTETSLVLTFTGENYKCEVVLSYPKGTKIDWNNHNLVIQNVRPDPSHGTVLGNNYYFLADVIIEKETITISGFSQCVPVSQCYNDCLNFFHQICYLNVVDYQFNQSLPTSADVLDNNASMVDAINKTLIPVWRPDTTFAIRVQYKDDIFEETSSINRPSRAFVLGFRTKGPVGHYHEYPTGNNTSSELPAYTSLKLIDEEEQFKPSGLKHYIDFSKSYPNADGNIVNAKPLYYQSPELLLFYTYPHVYQFYQNWNSYNGAPAVNSSLEVLIKDPIESPLVNDPNNPGGPQIPNVVAPANNEWQINDYPVITPDIAAINNMIENGAEYGNPCTPSPTILQPNGINNLVTPENPLEPLKLYTAIYNAVYNPMSLSLTAAQKREVHRYGFQTSRYKDFNEHISSYVLQRNLITDVIEKTAVYKIKKTFTASAITKSQQIINGSLLPGDVYYQPSIGKLPSADSLHSEAVLDYDKLIDRVFELKELEPAEFLQFNLIIDETTQNVLGILLRSPEPFNDPKTPITELNSSILMEVDTGAGYDNSNNYTLLYSKDRSNVFITNHNSSLNISRGLHRFSFVYKLYNGQNYVTKTTEQVILDFSTL